jgi:hypothetical protein
MPPTDRGADNQSNYGTGVVASGQTSVDIQHGLRGVPDLVLITPKLVGNATSAWRVSARTATTFTVTPSGDPGATTFTFDWLAAIGGPRTAY